MSAKILTTLDQKIAAYEAFFSGNRTTLVVVGDGGSGKSFALQQINLHPDYVICYGLEERQYVSGEYQEATLRIIFHVTEAELPGLVNVFNPEVIYFKNPNAV